MLACLATLGLAASGQSARAQLPSANATLPPGFEQVAGQYIDLVTDMPLTDEVRELTRVFDAAVPVWCREFEMPEASASGWRVRCCLMLERQRFIDAGLLPQAISHFAHGFQYGDRLWVTEQQSSYYRRHLMLHEGTHWIMAKRYGDQIPPWLSEGMAEWLGTHRWDGEQLSMGIIPINREEVPYWGRTRIIQEQLAHGVAPSLESIMRYSNTAHQQLEAYAWSWAAVIFFKSHPQASAKFAELLRQPHRGRDAANRWIFKQLSQRWPRLRQEWNAMLCDLDYEFAPQHGLLTLSASPQPLSALSTFTVEATQSWQASGLLVTAGEEINIQAAGEIVVGQLPKPWRTTADGVTLEYYRGQPLGRLLMTTLGHLPKEPTFSQPLTVIPVGSGGTFKVAQTGELHFRINEASGRLADNSGALRITVRP